jgi:lipid-binding SYLF domain-containing protein
MNKLLKFGFLTYGQIGRGLLLILLLVVALVAWDKFGPSEGGVVPQEKIDAL